MPAFKAAGASLHTVVSNAGVTAVHAGRKFGFAHAGTNAAAAVGSNETDAIVIATRHDSHARYLIDALEAGKHVFLEKPLCLTHEELVNVEVAWAKLTSKGSAPVVAVGFNRRFAPHVVATRSALAGVPGPKSFVMTVNAGTIPAEHWTQDRQVGGGRLIGEGCHFIDLLRGLAGVPIASATTVAMAGRIADTWSIHLAFTDGSIGAIHYMANGSKAFPKERLEVFAQGRVLQLDNFRVLRAFGWPGVRARKLWRQDKGQRACAAAFVEAVKTGTPWPTPFDEIVEISRVAIDLTDRGTYNA
jgi:predicted dehydrogenase